MKETLRQSFGFAQDMAQGSARGQEEKGKRCIKDGRRVEVEECLLRLPLKYRVKSFMPLG